MNSSYGAILTDSAGRTLYLYTPDADVRKDPIQRLREPPVGLADEEHDGRDDGHADDDGVDEDAAGQSQPNSLITRSPPRMNDPNTRIMIRAAAVIVFPVAASPLRTATGCRRS
jgi:hypothetical protein